jgi:hypothetical protein
MVKLARRGPRELTYHKVGRNDEGPLAVSIGPLNVSCPSKV